MPLTVQAMNYLHSGGHRLFLKSSHPSRSSMTTLATRGHERI